MILESNASRNEDRFYAILPSWNKYQHLFQNKNIESNWNITDLLSVKLKLYEIIYDDNDLRDKVILLYMCSNYAGKPILPSFENFHESYYILHEISNIDYAHDFALKYLSEFKDVKEYIEDYHNKKYKSISKQNLVDIRFNRQQQQYYLSVKANKHFIFNTQLYSSIHSEEELSKYSLENNNNLKLIYIPYFTYDILEFCHLFPINEYSVLLLSDTLLGNTDINIWILVEIWKCYTYGKPSLCSIDDDYITYSIFIR